MLIVDAMYSRGGCVAYNCTETQKPCFILKKQNILDWSIYFDDVYYILFIMNIGIYIYIVLWIYYMPKIAILNYQKERIKTQLL